MLRFSCQWRLPHNVRVALRYAGAFSSLRPYQESCLNVCLDALKSGAARVGLSLPTGSGKTTIFVSLISRLPPPFDRRSATQALILVNTIELALQVARQVEQLCPRLSVEIEQGALHRASGSADVTIATYQTLLRSSRIAKFNPNTFKVVVVDEAHHAAAPSYRRILAHFNSDIRSPDVDFVPQEIAHKVPIVGVSATFSRHDGLALGSVFQRIVYHRDFLEMISEQWLSNIRFTCVKAKLNLDSVKLNATTGDFTAYSLSRVVNTTPINELVVRSWLDKACKVKSLVKNVLTNTFRKAGIDARYIHSGTPAATRRLTLDAFKNGDFPILLNVAVLTEGADIPNVDCILIVRPTRSKNVLAQMIGRGMRLCPSTGKKDCHVIDFVDLTSRIHGVMSTPTLFGLDPDEVYDDYTVQDLRISSNSGRTQSEAQDIYQLSSPTSVTYVDYDDPFSMIHDTSGAPHISRLSKHAWVGCGGQIYVLECMGKGYIRVVPSENDNKDDLFDAYYIPTRSHAEEQKTGGKKSLHFLKKKQIIIASKLDDAIRGSDTYVKSKVVFGHLALGLSRSAMWRRLPASQSQKDFLNKRLTGPRRSHDNSTTGFSITRLENMTKGDAADIITRLKHGAKGRYSTKVRTQAKILAVRRKEQSRLAREHVQVGDLPVHSFTA